MEQSVHFVKVGGNTFFVAATQSCAAIHKIEDVFCVLHDLVHFGVRFVEFKIALVVVVHLPADRVRLFVQIGGQFRQVQAASEPNRGDLTGRQVDRSRLWSK